MTAAETELLMDCRNALADWINVFASEFCLPERVAEAERRISEGGGTLGYIGALLKRCDETLSDSGESKP